MGDDHVSRSGILYGSTSDDVWFSMEQFYRDHINEINQKLNNLDDDVWGKVILMERNKRIAKAYLRQTTFCIDGSCYAFDGKIIGFNSFENQRRDAQVEEMRLKIGEGVVLKIDKEGSIIAMARGMAPVIVQGVRSNHDFAQCYSAKVGRLKGRLEPPDPSHKSEHNQRAVKIFDMKVFKSCIEQELLQSYPNRKSLLYRTCIRVSLVKEENRPLKSPCWFMLVNLVAMDMLNAKVPPTANLPQQISSNPYVSRRTSESTIFPPDLQRSQHLSQSAQDLYGTLGAQTATLGRYLGASQLALDAPSTAWAAAQLQHLVAQQQQNQAAALSPVDQLAQLANTLALGIDPNPMQNQRNRGAWQSKGYMSESDASMMMHRNQRMDSSRKSSTTNDSRWGMSQSMDSLYEPIDLDDEEEDEVDDDDEDEEDAEDLEEDTESSKSNRNFSLRPQPAPPPHTKKLFPSNSIYGSLKPSSWSNGSTSDYESTKDIYDSSTCSSSSRSSNSAVGRSSSPSIASEAASESQTSDSGYMEPARPIRPTRTLENLADINPTSKKSKHHIPVETTPRATSTLNIHMRKTPAPPPPPMTKAPPVPAKQKQASTPADSYVSHAKFFMKAKRFLKSSTANHHHRKDSSPLEAKDQPRPLEETNSSKSSECDTTLESSSEAEPSPAGIQNGFKRSPPVPPHRRRRSGRSLSSTTDSEKTTTTAVDRQKDSSSSSDSSGITLSLEEDSSADDSSPVWNF